MLRVCPTAHLAAHQPSALFFRLRGVKNATSKKNSLSALPIKPI